MIVAALAIVSVIVLASWLKELIPVRQLMATQNLQWRALFKQYAYRFEDNPPAHLKKFLLWHLLASFIPCLWVAYFSYDTDWSFMILLFPIIWYYFWLRFFFWEKSDLHD